MKIIHVGLGKTGTSFLQNEIFPKVAKILNIEFIDPRMFMKKIKIADAMLRMRS